MKIFGMKMEKENAIMAFRMTWPSVLCGTIVVLAWLARHECYGAYNFNKYESAISMLLGFLVAVFIFVAGVTLNNTMEKRSKMAGAVRTNNKHNFMHNADKEIPFILDWFLFLVGTLIIGTFFLLDLESDLAGSIISFIISFVLHSIRQVAVAYDNPLEGVWRMKGVPKEWRDEVLSPKRVVEECQ